MDVFDGTWSELGHSIAPVSCWTCRRRRLRCDSRLPTCAKCAKAGYRCLGYGPDKPLVWVGLGRRTSKKVVAAMAAAAEAARVDKAADKASLATSSRASVGQAGELVLARRPTTTPQIRTSLGQAKIVAPTLPSPGLLLCRPTEPMFVGHNAKTRRYIEYYLQRCCTECDMIPTTPGEEQTTDPYRSLMALSQGSQLMLNIVVALAASHFAGSSRPEPKLLEAPYSPGRHDDNDDSDGVIISPIFSDARTYKSKAIKTLQMALNQLDHSDAVVAASLLLIWVEVLDSGTRSWRCHLDGMVGLLAMRRQRLKEKRRKLQEQRAAADYHLNGAYGPSPPVNSEAVSSPEQEPWTFQSYFEEACLVLHTLGTTFSTNKQDLAEVFGEEQVNRILDRVETRNWTGCPVYLLKVLRAVNKLHAVDATFDLRPRHARELLNQIDGFDAWAWASSCNTDTVWVQKRHHLAAAYRGAIEIFARRALQYHLDAHWSPSAASCEYNDPDDAACSDPVANSGTPPLPCYSQQSQYQQQEQRHLVEVAHAVAWHLNHLAPDDPHFKGALWPAFVAGAEARRDDDRDVVRRIFRDMYGLIHCQSIRRAMQVLVQIWASKLVVSPDLPLPEEGENDALDFRYREGSSPCSSADEPSWLEKLCRSGEELLLI
ncbi:hypothetical protein RB595_008889 [Gaeumannomyces hyphopodioides]